MFYLFLALKLNEESFLHLRHDFSKLFFEHQDFPNKPRFLQLPFPKHVKYPFDSNALFSLLSLSKIKNFAEVFPKIRLDGPDGHTIGA